jgi:hypothetical protein
MEFDALFFKMPRLPHSLYLNMAELYISFIVVHAIIVFGSIKIKDF